MRDSCSACHREVGLQGPSEAEATHASEKWVSRELCKFGVWRSESFAGDLMSGLVLRCAAAALHKPETARVQWIHQEILSIAKGIPFNIYLTAVYTQMHHIFYICVDFDAKELLNVKYFYFSSDMQPKRGHMSVGSKMYDG